MYLGVTICKVLLRVKRVTNLILVVFDEAGRAYHDSRFDPLAFDRLHRCSSP